MRVIMIVGDGMADQPLEELAYRTPLEAAETNQMDSLASYGVSGLLDPAGPGIAPSSDVANLALLGYDASHVYGRGPFEAAGAGIHLQKTDLAYRCNFSTINSDFCMLNERAGRIEDQEAKQLSESLQDIRLLDHSNIEVIYRQTLGFKGVLVLRGEGLSPNVTACLPSPGVRIGLTKPLDDSQEAAKTADVLNEFIRNSNILLEHHFVNEKRKSVGKLPANVLVPWSGGFPPVMQPFMERYCLKASCVAAVSLIKGIGRLTGMSVIEVSGATGDVNTDTLAKANSALRAIRDNDFVFVHVEGADEASHDGDLKGKITIIKKINAMVGRIIEEINLNDVCLVLLADHVTSLKLRKHTGDPVPITLACSDIARDGVDRYSERAAVKGGLCRIQGKDVMPLLLKLVGKSASFGE